MRDLRLAVHNAGILLRRSRSFGLLIVVGVAFALFCGGLVRQTTQSTEQQIHNSSIMRTIEVSSVGASRPISLTGDRMSEIAALPGVTAVQPWIQSGCLITESVTEVPGALWATPSMPTGQPPLVQKVREQPLPLTSNEIILPAHAQNRDLRGLLGTDITVEYIRRVTNNSGEPIYMHLHVVGLYDETIGGRDGPAAVYLSLDSALAMAAAREGVTSEAFGRSVGYPKVIVEVVRDSDVPTTQRRLSEMGFNASSMQSQLATLPPTIELFSILGQLVTWLLVLACLIAGLSIGAGLVHVRMREIGLLKALGFANRRVAKLLGLELCLFGSGAAAAGILLGLTVLLAAQQFLQGRVVFEVQMVDGLVFPPLSRILLLAVIPGLSMIIGGILPLWRAAKLPPDVALREHS